jgi:hypothetical protein
MNLGGSKSSLVVSIVLGACFVLVAAFGVWLVVQAFSYIWGLGAALAILGIVAASALAFSVGMRRWARRSRQSELS